MDIRALIHPFYVHHRNLAAINAAFMNLFHAVGQLSRTDESIQDILIPLCDASRRAQKRGLVAPMPLIPVPLLDQNDVEERDDEVETLGNLVHLVASLAELVTNLTSISTANASSAPPTTRNNARNTPSQSREVDPRPLLRESSSFVVVPSVQYPGEHFNAGTVEDFHVRRHHYLHDARIRVRAWLSRKDTLRRSRQYRHQKTPAQRNMTGISITWPIPAHDMPTSRSPTGFGIENRGETSGAIRNRPPARRAASQPQLRTDEMGILEEKNKPLPHVPLHLASSRVGSSKTTVRVERQGRRHEHSASDPTGTNSRLRKPKPWSKVSKYPPRVLGSTSRIEITTSASEITSSGEPSPDIRPTASTSSVPLVLADSNPYARDVNEVHRVRRKPVPTLSIVESPVDIQGTTTPSETSVTAVVAQVNTRRMESCGQPQADIRLNNPCAIAIAHLSEATRRSPPSYHQQIRTNNRTNHATHPVTSRSGDYYTIRARSTPSDGRHLSRSSRSSPCITGPIPVEPLPRYTPPAVRL